LRQKPNITAADGVSVTGAGGFPSPFFGTSAAAPHAAAIAALVKSAIPAFTPTQIRGLLSSTAIDIEAPGIDRDSGAGIVMPYAALLAAGFPGSAFVGIDSFDAFDNPGNGNGRPEAGEGARLAIVLKNYGVQNATAVSAALTSSTPGISVTLPNGSSYPDLLVSVAAPNASPLLFTVASDFPCPKTADFTLIVTYSGGLSPNTFTFPVPIGPPPFTITRNLDGTTPPTSPGVVPASGSQVGRLFRDGVASACGTQKVIDTGGANNPVDTSLRRYESFQFNTCANSPASCATVTLQGTNAVNLFTAAYAPAFNPLNLLQGYRADPGASAASRTYAFDVPAGPNSFAIDVHDVPINPHPSGILYTLTVSGACLGACNPPNHVPVAKAKNVTVFADDTCSANASIDDGSSDADGDPLTITQSPPGPYPLGTTPVILTVTDPKGATSQADGTVTVVDNEPPSVSNFSLSAPPLWPPNHRMVDVTVNYELSENCDSASCVLSVTSNEPENELGDGNTDHDWEIVDAHHVRVRAERSGNVDGRVYTVTLTCTDAAGNKTLRTGTLTVPHSR
jgi:Subtilase family